MIYALPRTFALNMVAAEQTFCRERVRHLVHRLLSLYIVIFTTSTATASGVQLEQAMTGGRHDNGGQRDVKIPAILVALEGGAAGENALRIWSRWASDVVSMSPDVLPTVWVLCFDPTLEASITEIPHVQPFVVEGKAPWATVLQNFMSRDGNEMAAVGLLGEGALPHLDLAESVARIRRPLSEATQQTAILTRSRSSGDSPEEDRWLSDKFVSQVWCNRAMLERSTLTRAGLETWSVQDLSLLDAIALLIRSNPELGTIEQHALVDGTKVIPSLFARVPAKAFGVGEYAGWGGPTATAAGSGNKQVDVNIGRLELALVSDNFGNDHDDDGDSRTGGVQLGTLSKGETGDTASGTSGGSGTWKDSRIDRAPWPPEYILETVATPVEASSFAGASKGLVLGSNVNCGYLDMATNFWRSVQKVTSGERKVLFVAMDEVSFDFMDSLDPGCTAMHPSAVKSERHSMKAGTYGDKRFAETTLVRPQLINSIISQGYTMLWSDADMVWLSNPLHLLPQIGQDSDVDVMLQIDYRQVFKCTCFMFVNPTPMSHKMLARWEENIVRSKATLDQEAFQGPLHYMRRNGLRVEFIPRKVLPAGKAFFDNKYQDNYKELYHNETLIVHNNWIVGHSNKIKRFKRYRMWYVDDVSFPDCTERRA